MVIDKIERIREVHDWGAANVRNIDIIENIVVHRNDMKPTALGMAQWFYDEGYKHTGSKRMSYHFWIRKNGTIEQALPLKVIAPAAKQYNRRGIQVCLHGDFRNESPTREQWLSLVRLCVALKRGFPEAKIIGHDPKKPCPGKNLSISALNNEVSEILCEGGRNSLRLKGVKL